MLPLYLRFIQDQLKITLRSFENTQVYKWSKCLPVSQWASHHSLDLFSMLDLFPWLWLICCSFISRQVIVHTMLWRCLFSFLQRHTLAEFKGAGSLIVFLVFWGFCRGRLGLTLNGVFRIQILHVLHSEKNYMFISHSAALILSIDEALEVSRNMKKSFIHIITLKRSLLLSSPSYVHLSLLMYFKSVHVFSYLSEA